MSNYGRCRSAVVFCASFAQCVSLSEKFHLFLKSTDPALAAAASVKSDYSFVKPASYSGS